MDVLIKNGSIYIHSTQYQSDPFYLIIEYISLTEMISFVVSTVCLTHRLPFVHSIGFKRGRTFIFFVKVTLYASKWWCFSKIKRSKVKVTENENKIVLRTRLRQNWIDLHQTKIKMINCPLHAYI